MRSQRHPRRTTTAMFSSFLWAFGCWMVLTWSVALEQLTAGVLLAVAVSVITHGLGPVVRPWGVLTARRLVALVRLGAVVTARLATAGLSLSRCIWSTSPRARSGMVPVATREHSDVGLGWLGLLTSLTPDSELVDLDRQRSLLLYYELSINDSDADRRESTRAAIERAIAKVCS